MPFRPKRPKSYPGFSERPSQLAQPTLSGWFVGPRKEMITPWSTNAVEITQKHGTPPALPASRSFFPVENDQAEFDKMLQRLYHGIDGQIFEIDKRPDPIVYN